MKNRLYQAAMIYAQRLGWAVLPLHSVRNGRCTCGRLDCKSPGKHPLISNGVRGATKDLATIKQWWSKWPWANIGIATGKVSGFFVVDIDGEEGEDSIKDLVAEQGPLPDTVEQITGSGGRHILFRYPANKSIPNKVGFFKGVDIRSDGGYVVAAPSIHISGRKYQWEVSSRPLEVEIAEAPEWLLRIIIDNPEKDGANIDWSKTILAIPKGRRNDTIARYTGRLLAHGITAKETYILMLALNRFVCQPPLQGKEVETIVKSILKKEGEKT
jgi:hypothetical protein